MTTISVEGGGWGGGGGGAGGGGEGGVGGAIGGGRGGKTALCTVTPKVDCAEKPMPLAMRSRTSDALAMRSDSASATPPSCVMVKTTSALPKVVFTTVTPDALRSGISAARLRAPWASFLSVRTRVAEAKEGAAGSGVGAGVCTRLSTHLLQLAHTSKARRGGVAW